MPKELDHPKKGLINIQSFDDNKCFKWWVFRELHPADHNSSRTTKANKLFGDELEFEDIKFLVKIKDYHKIEKKSILSALVFLGIKAK